MTASKLTVAQCDLLLTIEQYPGGAKPYPHEARTVAALVRKGFVRVTGDYAKVTDAGRAALRGES